MEVDMGEIDSRLKEINPNEIHYDQQAANETKSAEDDIAIAEAINEIERELNEDRRSFFDPNSALDVDLGEIDDKLKQISPSDGDFEAQGKVDAISAEDDIAIAAAINEVEKELKKDEKSIFNPTTVMMLVVAGGIITSKIAELFYRRG